MHPESGFRIAPNWSYIILFVFLFVCLFFVFVFFLILFFVFETFVLLLSSLVSGPNFLSISLVVLEIRKLLFIKNFTRNSEAKLQLCHWSKWRKPNLAWMSLIKSCSVLKNTRFTAFTVFELLREKQRERGGKITPITQIRVNT